MDSDEQHLNLLSIFHYIVGALALVFSFFPVIHLVIGLGIVTGRLEGDSGTDGFGLAMGWIFVGLALAMIAGGVTYAICTILAGRYLGQRRRYTFCLVMAAISCIFFPFGTVLGVFTIIVLSRPAVKALFTSAPRVG